MFQQQDETATMETGVSVQPEPADLMVSQKPRFTRDLSLAVTDARTMLSSPLTRPIMTGLVVAAGVLLPTAGAAFAHPLFGATNFDPTKLNQGVQSVVDAIHIICAVLVPLIFAAGFATLMYSGFSEGFRRIAIRVLSFAIVGVIALFLLADPLAQLAIGVTGCTDTNGQVTCPNSNSGQ